MSSWNPATRARNFVARIREMGESLDALHEEIAALRAETAALRDVYDSTQRQTHGQLAEIRAHASGVQAVANRASRRGTLHRRRLRVVFLVHNRSAWDSIGDVVSIMRESDDFDPIVVSIPHHYAGTTEPKGEGGVHRFLAERHVPHLRLRNDNTGAASELLYSLDPDVVFRQSQWDADVDRALSAESLGWTRLAIIPYETMNPTHNVPWDYPPVNSALDQHFQREAWLVFCTNEMALGIAQAETLTGARQYRAVGHPKADALRRAVPEWPFERTQRRRVMWSAHHSILDGWNDFGTFPSVKEDMLAWASDSPETEFVMTHHPFLRGTIRLPDSPITEAEFEEWLERWHALPNTVYSRAPYASLLAATDLLVTDGPSMITESQLLTVPTIFLERKDHIPFNEIGEVIVTGVHRVRDVAEAREVARQLTADGDPLADTQRSNVKRLFGSPGAAQRIVDTIRQEALEEIARIV